MTNPVIPIKKIIVPIMNSILPNFNGVRIIRIIFIRAKILPTRVKVFCVLVHPAPLSNNLTFTSFEHIDIKNACIVT